MASFAIVFGTGEGQTAKAAARIAETLEARGRDAEASDVDSLASPSPLSSRGGRAGSSEAAAVSPGTGT